MRALFLAALAGLLAAPLGAQVASYQFESDLDDFAQIGGQGAVTRETAAPLAGTGSLSLELAAETRELRLASLGFAVQPGILYRVEMLRQADLGAQLLLGIELGREEEWFPGSFFATAGGGLFATLPDTNQARLVLTLRVPGQALGRSVLVDEISIQQQAPLIPESGPNLYWDGSFDHTTWGWVHWVQKPEVMELSDNNPHSGQHCLHIESEKRTYIVFPSVPVKPYRLYRLTYRVRGQGTIWPGLHKLAPKDWHSMRIDTAERVGWVTPRVGEVKLIEEFWQQVELLTACESEKIIWFQPYFSFSGGTVDVDSVEMKAVQEITPEADSSAE